MESGPYQELKSRGQSPRFIAILITAVTIVLCLLVGIGAYILIAGNAETPVPVSQGKNVIEEVVIIEQVQPSARVAEHPRPVINKNEALDASIYEEVQEAIKQEVEEEEEEIINNNENYNFNEMPFLETLVRFSNDIAGQVLGKLAENERFAALFGHSNPETHSRERRSLSAIGANALTYFSYLNFGKFMFNEVRDITEYAVEGRKLSGDSDAMFLDGFWPAFNQPQDAIVEKIDTDVTSTEVVTKNPVKSHRPPSAYDNGWQPMVNKVSLKFIINMLNTLLNLMREYLMKDHVMECLWFMFCKDMNHQAKYQDPMGYLARINSVGLKVLVDREGREVDTVTSVWQALTKWEPLHCDSMFSKCDGDKALEIVNEVANASR